VPVIILIKSIGPLSHTTVLLQSFNKPKSGNHVQGDVPRSVLWFLHRPTILQYNQGRASAALYYPTERGHMVYRSCRKSGETQIYSFLYPP